MAELAGITNIGEVVSVSTAAELCREIDGLTKSRLDRWVTHGYVHASLYKGNRVFTARERDAVRVIVEMVNAGIPVETAARAVRDNGWISDRVRVLIGSRTSQKLWRAVQSIP
jgi:DNA-binding transcriptional MerR regulator